MFSSWPRFVEIAAYLWNRSLNRPRSAFAPSRLSNGGTFGKLPGGIYNTSYIQQYARAIDYDETAILAFYHREMNTAPVNPEPGRGKGRFDVLRPASVA